jgi:two-component system chemotaxis response regulator CheY
MKLRFAVVDDAPFLREILKNLAISLGGVCVGEADNGNEAVTLVTNTLPDLVFLDMVMPEKNGIEAAREIKEFFPSTKIIGCSTVDDNHLIQTAYAAGFDAYVTKPFTKDEILNTIKKLFPHLEDSADGRT